MSNTLLQEFTDALDEVIDKFPHQPQWQSLKLKFIREYSAYKRIHTPSSDSEMCRCCGREGAVDGVFCDKCSSFFSKHSSDAVTGKCDCGHLPKGPDIYIFAFRGKLHSLCSLECVRGYHEKLFGPLLRRLR